MLLTIDWFHALPLTEKSILVLATADFMLVALASLWCKQTACLAPDNVFVRFTVQ